MVNADILVAAFDVFWKGMGYEDGENLSVNVEFALYLNIPMSAVFQHDVSPDHLTMAVDRAKMLVGPNGSTVLAAYKIRRYSLAGRLKYLPLKPYGMAMLIKWELKQLIQVWWRSI